TQLLDSLPGPAAAADNGPEPALSLLCQVAALTLEGRVPASGGREPPVTAPQQGAHAPRSPDTAQPIRAVTPLHPRDMLARLVGGPKPYERFAQWREDLKATCDRPTEVTATHRAIHLGIGFFFAAIGFSFLLMYTRLASLTAVIELDQWMVRQQAL